MVFTRHNLPNHYYIYAYVRAIKDEIGEAGTPYYIGKGNGNRAWARTKQDQKRLEKPRDDDFVLILEHNLSEIGALALERRFIQWYGRVDLGTGILLNKTDGGDGSTGAKRSESWRSHMSKVMKGRSHDAETRALMSTFKKGKPWTEARRLAHENRTKPRKPCSEEAKRKIGAANKGRTGFTPSEETKMKRVATMRRNRLLKEQQASSDVQ